MKLTELEPRWVHEHVFVFRCPHCRNTWLSCKTAAMSIKEQFEHFRAANLEPAGPKYAIVPMREECAWQLTDGNRDFATMTLSPSIDASASGHWHGYITNGEIK